MDISEQIEKLKNVMLLANDAAKSNDLVSKIGAITLYAGLVDFYTIQLARLIEQIILKSKLTLGDEIKFKPNESSYFYDKRIDTRTLTKGIKALLPFKSPTLEHTALAERANIQLSDLIKKTEKFLDYRNTIIHSIGNPKLPIAKFTVICDKAIDAYNTFIQVHKTCFETLQPFRFSENEFLYFYGDS